MELSNNGIESPLDWNFVQIIWMFLTGVFSEAEAAFSTDGLGLKQIVLLAILEKPQSPQELRRMLGGPASTMSNMINELEKRGLAQRAIDPHDKRKFQVSRTEEGNRVLSEAIHHVQAVLDSMSLRMSSEEIQGLSLAKQALHRTVFSEFTNG